ncbi:MAG TPA: hypothetical protein VF021_08025 [Longimicrobiales bacterium]
MALKVRKWPARWVVAIVIAFALVILANAVFIYVAVTGADPVVSSYHLEHR